MVPTPKYVTDLLASFGQVVDRLTAVEKQNAVLAEQNRVLAEQVQELAEQVQELAEQIQQQNRGQSPTTTMARSFRYKMPKRTNPAASIKWVLADALPDHTEEELKALYKNFNKMALKVCIVYANIQGNMFDRYTDVSAQGKSVMKQTALDLLLEAHEELSFLHDCESYWPVGFAIQNSWTEYAKRQRKRAARLAARNASTAS